MPFHRLNEALRAQRLPPRASKALEQMEWYNLASGRSVASSWGQWGGWSLQHRRTLPCPPHLPSEWAPVFYLFIQASSYKQNPDQWKEFHLRLPSSFML